MYLYFQDSTFKENNVIKAELTGFPKMIELEKSKLREL